MMMKRRKMMMKILEFNIMNPFKKRRKRKKLIIQEGARNQGEIILIQQKQKRIRKV